MFFLFKVKRSWLTFLLSSSPLQNFPSLWSGAFRLEKPPTSSPDRWTLVCYPCGSVLLSYSNSGWPCCGTQASPEEEGGSYGSRLLLGLPFRLWHTLGGYSPWVKTVGVSA